MLLCDLSLNTMHISDWLHFSDIHVWQVTVAMCLRCSGIFKHNFMANLLPSPSVNKVWKSVNIWWSYGQEFGVLVFLTCSVYYITCHCLASQVRLYACLPLNAASRLWGRLNNVDLPVWAREPVFSLYIRLFHCDMTEAAVTDLRHYHNVSELFRRQLRPESRSIDCNCALVCLSVLSFVNFLEYWLSFLETVSVCV